MRARFTVDAANDIRMAVEWYDSMADRLGDRLLDQVDELIDRLEVFPNAAPPVAGFPGIRRARVRRFPYGVFYRVDGEDLVVLRMLHSRQEAPDRLPD